MLQFTYEFLDTYIDRQDYQLLETDTDSMYIALSTDTLEEAIKPEMLEKYRHGLYGFCTETTVTADSEFHWFPRECCQQHAAYDKRLPGVFKLEAQGDTYIGLCSKTYLVRSDDGECKLSSKGVNKTAVKDPVSIFRKVIDEKTSVSAVNKGIRLNGNTLHTYNQTKKGFSYFYCKRKVLDDGVSTVPLDIVLKPVSRFSHQHSSEEN
jgi:hypothetical protein